MELNQNSGAEISLEEAQLYVSAFRKKYPAEVKAFFVGNESLRKVLNQENCMGARIYNGYDEKEGRLNIVIVGVDNDGCDMTKGVILDRTMPCPDFCDIKSPLMY